ncbi:MAG: OmpA family protein [Aestuariivita sp.]|nr:OmpA family protein [Aestuariivita sp.]MCY4346618.1 OmpA family protein [Aestuariivita sp.]
MITPASLIVIAVFVTAALSSMLAAGFAAAVIEKVTEAELSEVFMEAELDWTDIGTDGLLVTLAGISPSEGERMRAFSAAGSVVDATRIIDEMEVLRDPSLLTPEFSLEILRNDENISIIGLIPTDSDRDKIIAELEAIDARLSVLDLIETADYPIPKGWNEAVRFAVYALRLLNNSKISVTANEARVTAFSQSAQEKENLEQQLYLRAPSNLRITMDIAAPRPVITPFTLRYVLDENGGRFDTCSAPDAAARERILSAAQVAGLARLATCTIGLGVPTTKWSEAVESSIQALATLGGGTVTISDVDISLLTQVDVDQREFDDIVGELANTLPDVFELHATLIESETDGTASNARFSAMLGDDGIVRLRGRLSDEALHRMVTGYAKSRFGSTNVRSTARVVDGLPSDWSTRVLVGLEALSMLNTGTATVLLDNLKLQGVSHDAGGVDEISRVLTSRLSDATKFEIAVEFAEPPPAENTSPSPQACEAMLAQILRNNRISFEPGSARIALNSHVTLDEIAKTLRLCDRIPLEIQGHTDSQGREEMNLRLSQRRAQTVLNELIQRRVLTSGFQAKGYGEEFPIADNGTEVGREANRRIEFRLIEQNVARDIP